MRPRAGQRYIQVIAPRLGFESACATRTRFASRGYPVPKRRVGADELTFGLTRVVPAIVPLAIYQQSHGSPHCSALRIGSSPVVIQDNAFATALLRRQWPRSLQGVYSRPGTIKGVFVVYTWFRVCSPGSR